MGMGVGVASPPVMKLPTWTWREMTVFRDRERRMAMFVQAAHSFCCRAWPSSLMASGITFLLLTLCKNSLTIQAHLAILTSSAMLGLRPTLSERYAYGERTERAPRRGLHLCGHHSCALVFHFLFRIRIV